MKPDGMCLLCGKTFPGETQHIRLFTSDRDPMTSQSTDTTIVQLCETTGFTGVPYRSMGEWFLRGTEVIQDGCITKAHPSTGDSSQKLGTWSTLYSL